MNSKLLFNFWNVFIVTLKKSHNLIGDRWWRFILVLLLSFLFKEFDNLIKFLINVRRSGSLNCLRSFLNSNFNYFVWIKFFSLDRNVYQELSDLGQLRNTNNTLKYLKSPMIIQLQVRRNLEHHESTTLVLLTLNLMDKTCSQFKTSQVKQRSRILFESVIQIFWEWKCFLLHVSVEFLISKYRPGKEKQFNISQGSSNHHAKNVKLKLHLSRVIFYSKGRNHKQLNEIYKDNTV